MRKEREISKNDGRDYLLDPVDPKFKVQRPAVALQFENRDIKPAKGFKPSEH